MPVVPSDDQRIPRQQGREPAEVTIRGPKLGYALGKADRRDPRVVEEWSARSSRTRDFAQPRPVRWPFAQTSGAGASEQSGNCLECDVEWGGELEPPPVGDYPDELVCHRPRQPPGASGDQVFDRGGGRAVVAQVWTVGVDDDVGVERDQAPGPGSRSSRLNSSASLTPPRRPPRP